MPPCQWDERKLSVRKGLRCGISSEISGRLSPVTFLLTYRDSTHSLPGAHDSLQYRDLAASWCLFPLAENILTLG